MCVDATSWQTHLWPAMIAVFINIIMTNCSVQQLSCMQFHYVWVVTCCPDPLTSVAAEQSLVENSAKTILVSD